MNFGQGSVVINSKVSGGAPFGANAAFNGVSVDPVTGQIVLGDDTGIGGLAELVANRLLSTNGFVLSLLDSLTSSIDLAGAVNTVNGDEAGGFAGQFIFNDTGTNDQGVIAFLNSLTRFIFGYTNRTSGATAAIGGTRGNFQVVDDLANFTAPTPGLLLEVLGGLFGTTIESATSIVAGTTIQTDDPGGGSGQWRLGIKQAGVATLDLNNFVEISIHGTVIRLGIVL